VECFDNSVQQTRLACALRAENGNDNLLCFTGPVLERLSAGPLGTDCIKSPCGAEKQQGWHSRAAFADTVQDAKFTRPYVPVYMFTFRIRAQVCWIGYLLETDDAAYPDMPHEKQSTIDDPESGRGTPHADYGDINQYFVRQPDRAGQEPRERQRDDQADCKAYRYRDRDPLIQVARIPQAADFLLPPFGGVLPSAPRQLPDITEI